MKELFESWILEFKKNITRPDKYSSTIITISNHLYSKGNDLEIYSIREADEVIKIRQLYFSYDEFYYKNITGNRMYSRSLDLYIEFLDSSQLITGNTPSPEIQSILKNNLLTETEKESIILSRRGQGKYRENLIKIWGKCSISGYPDYRMLVASHIKPWSNSNNTERIDPYNGLLLLPTYDKLFDLGLISFIENGNIIISSQLKNYDLLFLKKEIKITTNINHLKYLDFHIKNIYKK
ncbi:HNH endonuclease signature motif containing protein [Algoriphagus sp. D3-2-R+10]|uniref:HNH endonuclease n=1 Tax=Algoriphagus aurantiacus TaxID=3103948 RepID=UPI002B3BF1D1|nr:HNH endonuclease signature motif containing protein [Algoriphagus sp. D3-2-R+10]MEB2777478.1 HNH endonuclease signature motif containing protein [Algoriphagus sp. D3-2-R+10]